MIISRYKMVEMDAFLIFLSLSTTKHFIKFGKAPFSVYFPKTFLSEKFQIFTSFSDFISFFTQPVFHSSSQTPPTIPALSLHLLPTFFSFTSSVRLFLAFLSTFLALYASFLISLISGAGWMQPIGLNGLLQSYGVIRANSSSHKGTKFSTILKVHDKFWCRKFNNFVSG